MNVTILIKIIFLLYLYITLSLWIVYINPFHLAWSTRQGTEGIRNMKGPVSLKNLRILPKASNAVTAVNDINLHYQIRINWTSHLLIVHAVCIKNCCQIYTIFFKVFVQYFQHSPSLLTQVKFIFHKDISHFRQTPVFLSLWNSTEMSSCLVPSATLL